MLTCRKTFAINSLLLALSCATFGVRVFADEAPKKHEVDERTFEHQKRSSQLFKTLPSLHLLPEDDRLIFSLNYSRIDTQSDLNTINAGSHTHESLKLDGYTFQPMIALTNKSFGIGLSGDVGQGTSTYQDLNSEQTENGTISHRGIGLHGFYNPTPEAKSLFLTTNLSISGMNVVQRANQVKATTFVDSASEWETLQYRAYKTYAGLNLVVKPLKFLSVIPWGNVSYMFSPEFEKATKDENSTLDFQERLTSDSDFFLQKGLRFEYGIDLALKISKLEIHFGNLLGSALASKNQGDEDFIIRDHSFTVGISFQTGAKNVLPEK